MAEKTLLSMAVLVSNLAHTGYRRAGVALVKGENVIPADTITETQLAQLKADHRLKVAIQDESDPSNQDGNQSSSVDEGAVPGTVEGEGKEEPSVASEAETITSDDESGSSDTGGDSQPTPDVATPKTLNEAIALLDPANVEHFLASGKPSVEALEKLLGHAVTAAERDEAWETFLAEQEV